MTNLSNGDLLDGTVSAFEAQFRDVSDEIGFSVGYDGPAVRDGRDWSRAPNGVRYLSITSGGLKPEGANQDWRFHDTIEGACLAWIIHATQFAKKVTHGKPASLFWRMRPEVETKNGKFAVYSRMAVGDPPKEVAVSLTEKFLNGLTFQK